MARCSRSESDAQGPRLGKRLKRDPQLRLELDYCGPRGLPHSEFLTWSEDDQDKALAWLRAEQAKCSECGTVPEEWVAGDGVRPAIPPPYEVDTMVCYGCEERERFGRYLDGERGEGSGPEGVKIVLRPADWSEYPKDRHTTRLVPVD